MIRAGSSPIAADREEIEALQLAVNTDVSMERCNYIAVGNTVRIVEGPLAGLKGILVSVQKSHRLVLSISLLCRSVLIEIDRQWIAPCEELPLTDSATLAARATQ